MSSVKLNTKYLANYVNPDELTGIRHQVEASAKMPVSYTHLTLPTKA